MVIQMDETIGVKGGANDRRRMMIINQNQKKKLAEHEEEREIAELEKKVRRKQFYTLIKTLPIVIGGGTIQTLYDTATGKKRDNKEEENSRWRIKEYDQDITHLTPEEFEEKRRKIITTPTGEKIVVYIETPIDIKIENPKQQKIKDTIIEPQKQKENTTTPIEEQKKTERFIIEGNAVPERTEIKRNPDPETKTNTAKPTIGIGTEQVDIESFIDQELGTVDFTNLSPKAQETLGKLNQEKL